MPAAAGHLHAAAPETGLVVQLEVVAAAGSSSVPANVAVVSTDTVADTVTHPLAHTVTCTAAHTIAHPVAHTVVAGAVVGWDIRLHGVRSLHRRSKLQKSLNTLGVPDGCRSNKGPNSLNSVHNRGCPDDL